jgi:hypothetical protein
MATLLKVLNNLADIKSAGVLHFASELRLLRTPWSDSGANTGWFENKLKCFVKYILYLPEKGYMTA